MLRIIAIVGVVILAMLFLAMVFIALGVVAEVNRVNPDGSVGEFIGFFEFRDTGAGMDSDGDGKGDTIINGTSIDIWVNSLEDAYAWVNEYGDYVYIKLIKAKG